jgi:hypothetical protein
MCRAIGRAIEMRTIPACFLMQEPPCGMIPWHEPVVEQQVAMSGRGHTVFVRRASQPSAACQSRTIAIDDTSERLRQVIRAKYTFHLRDGR